ncbi:unnamed protein product [Owenia fusiformis]|nr:unnamed protein product [Owenia fusiformis]
MLNDIVAIDETHLYATMPVYVKGKIVIPSMFLYLRLGLVLHINMDEETVETVGSGYMMPNGINASPDKRHIYLSNMGDRNIVILERNSDFSLTEVKTIELYSAIDNIDVDSSTGDLWLGDIAIFHKAMAYISGPNNKDPGVKPPARVLQVKMSGNTEPKDITDVFVDDELILTGSVANRYKNAMLVGSVNHNMVYCQLQTI